LNNLPGRHAPDFSSGRAREFFAFNAVGTARRFGGLGERTRSLGRERSDGTEVSMEVVLALQEGMLRRSAPDRRNPISRQALE
jgi:hypothetical protein